MSTYLWSDGVLFSFVFISKLIHLIKLKLILQVLLLGLKAIITTVKIAKIQANKTMPNHIINTTSLD